MSVPAQPGAPEFSPKGEWTEADYLSLTDSTNHLVELVDGYLEVMPLPTEEHQFIADYVGDELKAFVLQRRAGKFIRAPFRIKLAEGKFREPDLAVMLAANLSRTNARFWEGTDLVVEIVSPGHEDHTRDHVTKRAAYAAAGIAEYWTIDPQDQSITVLVLPVGTTEYAARGVFTGDAAATSSVLAGFLLVPAAVFAAASGL